MPTTPSRLGQVEATGDQFALFLKQFSGEVLTQFDEVNKVLPMVTQRTISNGRAAQFPVIGNTTAKYHAPGTEIVGTAIVHNEVTLTVDMPLIADTFIANIDEAMNHYDVRAPYGKKLGNALANQLDRHLLQTAVKAARSAARISTDQGGSVIAVANLDTDMDALVASMFDAATLLDNKNVPEDGRFVFLKPAVYNKLAQNTKVLNKDWGGAGVFADGKVLRVAGIEIFKSTHVPNAAITTGTVAAGFSDKYIGDFSKTVGVVFTQDTVGALKLMDITMEAEYSVRWQGTLMVAKYAMGHGILNPATAVELAKV
jgi:hypothetical protein